MDFPQLLTMKTINSLFLMVPAMMGMMGMMSFKGMMFSLMSFMIAKHHALGMAFCKMMLLMKILEKKGGGGGAGGGDGGWAAGGGGGTWMPAGGQDYGGGGYDANGQWQSRSIIEKASNAELKNIKQPVMTYVKPVTSKSKDVKIIPYFKYDDKDPKLKSRRKRGIIETLQNAYLYWTYRALGIANKKQPNIPKYKYINGVRYIYHPTRYILKAKSPKEYTLNENERKPLVVTDFNKGEIVEERTEGRMNKKKLQKMKDNVNETVDENPWE